MNRREFMDELERQLSDVPLDDRIDALQYYEDYFEDAGFEKEQDIINELKSPEDVAKIIKKDLGIETEESNKKSEYKDYRTQYNGQNERYTGYNNGQNEGYTGYNNGQNEGYTSYNNGQNGGYTSYNNGQNGGYSTGQNVQPKKSGKIDKRLVIVLLICTLPITIGPVLGFFGALFGIIIGVFAFTLGMYAGAIGCVIGAVALLVTGTFSAASLVFGIGLILFAVALAVTLLCSFICRVVLPTVFGGIRKLFQYFFKDGEATA